MQNCEAHWGVAYHTNSESPRARKWYYIARLVHADDKWWCIGRHPTLPEYPNNMSRARARNDALNAGLPLLHGVFTDAPSPRNGPEMRKQGE